MANTVMLPAMQATAQIAATMMSSWFFIALSYSDANDALGVTVRSKTFPDP
jgi:hypothetical protein